MNLLVAAFACVMFLIYLRQLYVKPEWGLISYLGAHFLNFTFGLSQGLVGGFHVDLIDLVNFSLVVAGTLRTLPRIRRVNASQILAYGFVAFFGLSLLRGVLTFGIKIPINEARGLVVPVIGILYFMTVPVDEESLKRYVRIFLWYGAALCLVAIFATAGLPIGSVAWAHADPDPIVSQGIDGRVLPSDAAASIALCGFFALAAFRERRPGSPVQFLPLGFIAMAIYLRHRSVWTMIIAGLISLFFLDGKLFRRLMPSLVAALGVVLIVATYASLLKGNVIGAEKFSESTTSEGTFRWRVDSWVALITDKKQTPLTELIGNPTGSGYERLDSQSFRWINVQPHDQWVDAYIRYGAFGSLVLLLFTLRTFFRLLQYSNGPRSGIYPMTSAWVIVCAGALCYSISYNISADMSALLGIANAIIGASGLTAFSPAGSSIGGNPSVQIASLDFHY